jgi:hypothetical protein
MRKITRKRRTAAFAHRHGSILGLSHYTDTSEPVVDYAANNMVNVNAQSVIQTD